MNNRRLARAAARLVAARKVRHHPRGRRPLRPRSVPGHRRLSAPCLLRRDAAARRRERQRQRAKRRANRCAAAGPEGRTGRDSALGEVQRLLAREPVLARQARRRPFLRRQLGMGDGTVQARPLRWRSGGGGGRRRQGGAEGGKGSEPPRAGLPGRTLNRRGGGGNLRAAPCAGEPQQACCPGCVPPLFYTAHSGGSLCRRDHAIMNSPRQGGGAYGVSRCLSSPVHRGVREEGTP